MLRLLLILTSIVLVSCTKDPATFNLENLNDNKISCFGHAGMGFHSIYPANSFPGFETCLNRGADGTEMDIQVTKDSVLVIMHEEYLQESTSCSGIIKDLNWSEVKDCYIKSNFFKHTKLLSFDEFMLSIPNPKQYIFTWDCKLRVFGDDLYYKLFARTIVRTINRYDLNNNIFIENPFDDFLQNIKDLKNDANIFLLADDFESGFKKVKDHQFFGISMNAQTITASEVKMAHDQNIRVTIYGVQTEKENYSAVEKCPDFIQTDDINYLLKIFGKYNKHKGYWYSFTK